MAANINPIFVLVPLDPQVRISTANTGRDGSGTLGTVVTAGTNGDFYKGVRVQAEATTTAGVVRIFVQKAASGNFELFKEIMIPAVTPSTTVEAFSFDWLGPANTGITLAAGSLLCASTHNAETFSVSLFGGGQY